MKKCLTLCLCLTALLCLIFLTTPKAEAATYGNLTYEVNGGEATITGWYTSATGALTIPATINGYPVTAIGDDAFEYCRSLTSVTIPDSVTTIGKYAFYECTGLTDVYITDLNAWCKISFGKNFANPLYYADNGHILDADGKELTELVLDTSVTSIPYDAFRNCKSLTSITIPDSVTTIGSSAFRDCTSLTSITIPDRVTTIGYSVFYNCIGLTSVTIPNSVTTIGSYAFYECTSLTSVTIPDRVTTIGYCAFDNCTSLTSVTIGNGVTTIDNYAFYGCTSLTSVTIGDSVTTIGDYAFHNCTSLTKLQVDEKNPAYSSDAFGVLFNKNKTILIAASGAIKSYTVPDSVTTIGDSAFSGCTRLTSVTIGDSVTTIGDYAFRNCTGLTSVTIPDSVTTIGSYAFYECTSLTSVTIGDSVTTIVGSAFSHCTSLTSVTIGDSVTTIGDDVFSYCTSLTGITIPDSVTTIGDDAFDGCTSLTSITIPDSVTSIGDDAFYNCYKLKNVYYSGTEAQWKNISIGFSNSPLNNATKHYSHIHDYTLFPAETVAPTCTTGGYTIYTCVYGETMKGDSVPALGHAPGTLVNQAVPTCTAGGYTDYLCSRCGVQYRTEIVASLDHDYTGPEKTVEPTCTASGRIGASCTRCDAVREDTVLDALGHQVVLVPICDPTCTEKGVSKAGTQCERCKTYFVEPVWIPALGHSFTDYISNNDATYFADGTKTATCTTCGEKDTVVDEGTRLIPEGNVILLHPENVTANSGATVSFSIEAFGQIVSYQWQYRKVYKWFDTSLEGFATDTLTLTATGARNGYDYRCVVTFADGTVLITDAAELLVNTTITVTKSPNNQTAVLGDKGQFTASAEGEGIKYQWQYCRPDSGKWIDTAMEGATKATVYIETTKSRDGYQYRCKITDVTGKVVYTEAATLRVMSITGHPADQFTAPGKTVTFTVTTNVTGGVTYQWQYRKSETANWTNTTMTGYNTATLSVAATLARNGYQYRCIITGSKNSKLESMPATLHAGNPVQFTAQPQDLTVIDTETAILTVTATNAYAYCWQYRSNGNSWRNTSLTGYNTDTLTVPAVGKNGYQYRCIITGLDGNTYTSEAATLTVVEAPFLEVISDPSDRTVPAERTVRFAAFADGDVIGCQWQYTLDGETWQNAPGEGANTNILTVVATADLNGAQFRCVFTGQYGMQVITQSATLTVQ